MLWLLLLLLSFLLLLLFMVVLLLVLFCCCCAFELGKLSSWLTLHNLTRYALHGFSALEH